MVLAALLLNWFISFWLRLAMRQSFPFKCLVSSCTVPSTIITAPSTMMPKSIAPKLIRLAPTPKMRMRMNANRSDNGMTDAVTSPPRRLPSNTTSTKKTMSAPSVRLLAIVDVVRSMS